MRQHLRVAFRAFGARDDRPFGEGLAKLGMVGRAVIALAVIFPDEFPIGLFDNGALISDLRAAEPMRSEVRLHLLAERGEIHRSLRKADEDIAGHAFAGDRLQAEPGLVETLRHLAGEQQAPVKIVAPLVIGADEPHGCAFVGRAHAAPAVAASVVEGADFSLEIAHDHDRIVADLQREEGSRVRKLAIMSREQPVPAPDQLQVEPEEIGVGIEGLREAEAVAAPPHEPKHFVARIHVCRRQKELNW